MHRLVAPRCYACWLAMAMRDKGSRPGPLEELGLTSEEADELADEFQALWEQTSSRSSIPSARMSTNAPPKPELKPDAKRTMVGMPAVAMPQGLGGAPPPFQGAPVAAHPGTAFAMPPPPDALAPTTPLPEAPAPAVVTPAAQGSAQDSGKRTLLGIPRVTANPTLTASAAQATAPPLEASRRNTPPGGIAVVQPADPAESGTVTSDSAAKAGGYVAPSALPKRAPGEERRQSDAPTVEAPREPARNAATRIVRAVQSAPDEDDLRIAGLKGNSPSPKLIAAVAGVLILGAGGLWLATRGTADKEEPAEALSPAKETPSPAAPAGNVAATAGVEAAPQPSEEQALEKREEATPPSAEAAETESSAEAPPAKTREAPSTKPAAPKAVVPRASSPQRSPTPSPTPKPAAAALAKPPPASESPAPPPPPSPAPSATAAPSPSKPGRSAIVRDNPF